MKYAIVDSAKAEQAGINLKLHRVQGGKVILNENELLMLGRKRGIGNKDMAVSLGGDSLMSRSETREITNQWEDIRKRQRR